MKLIPLLFLLVIQTDGFLSESEWSGVKTNDIGDGNKALMKQEGDVLYVALNSTKSFWAHFYLSDGKSVKVMHASAALGAIEYRAEGSLWKTADKSFEYGMRDREYNAAKMDEYYSKHGWVGNNNNAGDKKTIEVKFDLKDFKPKYFACVMATPEKYYSFPGDLKDDTVLTKLVQGYAVDSLKFDLQRWHKL